MRFNSNFRKYFYMVLQFIVVPCVFIIPFIKTSNGNSLLRFDIPSLELHAFNSVIEFSDFFIIFLGVMFGVFAFIFMTQILGRVWCGQLCPQSFFALKIEKIIKKFKNKKIKKVVELTLALSFSFILSSIWSMYFVSPYEFLNTLQMSNTFLIIWLILSLFLFIDFFLVRFRWCKYVCPYSKFQVVMTDDDTLYVGMFPDKENECLKCLACVRVCPTKIDPRKTPDADCIYCESCVAACNKVFKRKNKPGILGYVWGKNNKFNMKRVNLIVTFLITIALFVTLTYSLMHNTPLSISYSKINKIKEGVYTVEVSIENNIGHGLQVILSPKNKDIEIEPKKIPLLNDTTNTQLTINVKDNNIDLNHIELEYLYDYKKAPVLSNIIIK